MQGGRSEQPRGEAGSGGVTAQPETAEPSGGGLGAPCLLPGCWVWSHPSPISSAPRGAFPAEAPRSLQRCPAPRRDASQPQAEELVPAFWGQIWRFQLRLSLPAGRAAPRALQSRGLASAPAPAAACSSNAFIASLHPPSPLHAALGISHTAAGLRGGSFFYFIFLWGGSLPASWGLWHAPGSGWAVGAAGPAWLQPPPPSLFMLHLPTCRA